MSSQEQQQQQEQYEAWLASKSVSVRSDLLRTTRRNVVAGWGCVALQHIRKGTVLFSIPRGACFSASDDDNDDKPDDENDDPTARDTQRELAERYLRLRSTPEWSPFLTVLTTPTSLPWTYDSRLLPALGGTELEYVVENKLSRLGQEYESIRSSWNKQDGKEECFTWREYLDASSVVASHANPWFGVSIVPFNTTLNWGFPANVEFERECDGEGGGDVVVGRATADIPKGSELFQSYGGSVAELLYRCGFAPVFPEGEGNDSVSLFVSDIVRACVEGLSEKDDVGSTKAKKANDKTSGMPISSTMSDPSSRMEALKKSGAIDACSWDGMEDYLTAELCRPSVEFVAKRGDETNGGGRKRRRHDFAESAEDLDDEQRKSYDDGGVSKLVGICLVLAADEESWKRASSALDNMPNHDDEAESNDGPNSDDDDESDAESRTDDISASIMLSSLANLNPEQSRKLQQCALDVGMGGHDPWRALLMELSSVKTLEWEVAFEASRLVMKEKMDRLVKGGEVSRELVAKYPEEKEALDAVEVLRGVEMSLLSNALDILNIPFR